MTHFSVIPPIIEALFHFGRIHPSTMENPTGRARSLRATFTDAERKFWRAVRSRQLGGYKFRRQVWVGDYIVDFVCVERNLVVELDGGQHAENRLYDEKRTLELAKRGLRVVRYWNTDVLQNLDGVLRDVLSQLER